MEGSGREVGSWEVEVGRLEVGRFRLGGSGREVKLFKSSIVTRRSTIESTNAGVPPRWSASPASVQIIESNNLIYFILFSIY